MPAPNNPASGESPRAIDPGVTACLLFERPIVELEHKIEELRQIPDVSLNGELRPLERKRDRLLADIFGNLTPWQTVEVARHPRRPQFMDYVRGMCDEFIELHGDRLFGEDMAICTGLARIGDRRFLVLGHRKGRETREKLACNFGCAHPEGYRKALRVMKMAEKFSRPIFTFVDTPGAYPGSGAEARGVAEAIAKNLREMAILRVPIIVTVIGEGGSGGALGIGVGDRVNILQYATYSVISPESCSSILWRDQDHPEEAAEALRLTSPDLVELGLVDEIVPEPEGGAHNDAEAVASALGATLERQLDELSGVDPEALIEKRYRKFRGMGALTGLEE